MGDFLIDFRPRDDRSLFRKAAEFLRFEDHVACEIWDFPEFSLAATSVDSQSLWGAYRTDDILSVVCGRIGLEEKEWQSAERIEGTGGLAAKYVAQTYRDHGTVGLERFSGNFALLLWDRRMSRFFIVSDLCGAVPIFKSKIPGKAVFCSHPDALATCLAEDQNWDEDSLKEFLLTSVVTPPHTYYKRLESAEVGSIISVDLKSVPVVEKTTNYFSLCYQGDDLRSESDLAEELGHSFVSSIRKRTLPRLGPVAVALSGGLDSRTILAAASDRTNVLAFCCFNEENFEFAVARTVARTLDVKLVPLTRNFDYYADNAESGIRIAGGMGTFANNHFLGISRQLRELGVQNLLTGCYCDYLFKALPLNTTSSRFFRNERLAPYSNEFYFYHYRMEQPSAKAVRDRLDERFPGALRTSRAPEDVFKLERLRTFPLFQEGDNAQRLIPQRVLYSYLPVADRSVLETYCKIPYYFKLNRSLFKKTVEIICGPDLCRIPDANTGSPANASLLRESFGAATTRIKRKLQKLKPTIASATSWPDWNYYVPHSAKLKSMWEQSNPAADELFRKVLPSQDIRRAPSDYAGRDLFLFVQMLSLKIWLNQRC